MPIETDPSAVQRLTSADGKPYIFGGVYQWHFGHTIAEFIHRLWVLNKAELAECTVLYVAEARQAHVSDFFKQVMEYMGVRRFEILTRPHIVDDLIIAEQGKSHGVEAAPAYFPYLNHLAFKNGLLARPAGKTKRNVAILRGHLKGRRYFGEQHLADYLEEQGYYIFRSENHSISEQLQTIARAENIIISDGSACHLFDLLPKLDTKVAFLARSPRAKLARVSIKSKVRELYCFRSVKYLIVPRSEQGQRRKTKSLLYADLEKVISFLKCHEFLANEAPEISFPPYTSDIEEYLAVFASSIDDIKRVKNRVVKLLSVRQKYSSKANWFKLWKWQVRFFIFQMKMRSGAALKKANVRRNV